MGYGSTNSTDYNTAVQHLHQTGQTFARSAHVAQTGNYSDVADILNPRKLKNGMRESCFAQGFKDVKPIIVSLDCTGSMEQVPYHVQSELAKMIDLLIEQGVTEHPNILFMAHDDEHCFSDAVFQMSQFEIATEPLIKALNEMVIPGYGGGNRGEAYHLSLYAAARHTHLESYERNGEKGFFFMVCDEEPYYGAGDPAKYGTSPKIAKEVFGDSIEKEVTMLDSLKEVCKRYHVFIIRPGHTSNGKNHSITKLWQKLLSDAGENPEHVMEVSETEAIISTMVMAIGQTSGIDRDDLVEVLIAKGATGVQSAIGATKKLTVSDSTALVASTSTTVIKTTDDAKKGGRRRS
jgi:hypothetical protein